MKTQYQENITITGNQKVFQKFFKKFSKLLQNYREIY